MLLTQSNHRTFLKLSAVLFLFFPQAHVDGSVGGPILQGPGPSVWGAGEAPQWATQRQAQAWGHLQKETDEVKTQESWGPSCPSATVRIKYFCYLKEELILWNPLHTVFFLYLPSPELWTPFLTLRTLKTYLYQYQGGCWLSYTVISNLCEFPCFSRN